MKFAKTEIFANAIAAAFTLALVNLHRMKTNTNKTIVRDFCAAGTFDG